MRILSATLLFLFAFSSATAAMVSGWPLGVYGVSLLSFFAAMAMSAEGEKKS